jgi:ABC-2 type transport system permease protein
LFAVPTSAFLLALTALTYQFQGWVASMMANPRRRRAILIGLPFCLVMMFQLPAILMSRFSDRPKPVAPRQAAPEQIVPEPLTTTVETRGETPGADATKVASKDADSENANYFENPSAERAQSEGAIEDGLLDVNAVGGSEEDTRVARQILEREAAQAWIGKVRWANRWIPPLWLAGSVESIMSGTWHVVWMTCAMFAMAAISFRSNYDSTMRYYKGASESTKSLKARADKADRKREPTKVQLSSSVRLIERSLPWVHEDTNAVLAMTWQSMVRAPEVKMFLLLPFVAPFILFGAMQAWRLPAIDELKAGTVVCCSAFCLLMAAGLISNQFGFDRSGFRAFVLSPIRRDRILFARNLAIAPFLLTQSMLMAMAISWYFGLAWDKIICSTLLTAAMLPTFCLLMNTMAILTPFPLAAGSIQPQQFHFYPMLINIALSMFLPAIVGVTLLPLAIEWGMDHWIESVRGIPIALGLSFPLFGVSAFLYAQMLPWQGRLLTQREQSILQTVTSKVE